MIVRRAATGIHLISQPDHAALSRRIMEAWRPLADHPRRASILLAIGEHDNGWREPDTSPLIDADHHVADFVHAPVEVRQDVWPRGVNRLAHDPLAATLVAEHAITVYDRFRHDQAWTSFFAQMETLRNQFRDRAAMSQPAVQEAYVFVRLGDLLSLTFCTGWTDEQHYDRWTVVHRDGRVTVRPDGLDGAEIPIDIRARELSTDTFPSAEALRAALAAAPHVTLHGIVAS